MGKALAYVPGSNYLSMPWTLWPGYNGICLQLLPVISGLLPFIEIAISTGFPVIKPISGNKNDSSSYDIIIMQSAM